jgi:hypothetical protein
MHRRRLNAESVARATIADDREYSRRTKIPSRHRLQPKMISQNQRRILKAGENIFSRQGGILLQNVFDRITRSEKLEDGLRRDPRPFDNGTTTANGGIDDDSFAHVPSVTIFSPEASLPEVGGLSRSRCRHVRAGTGASRARYAFGACNRRSSFQRFRSGTFPA